MKSLLTRLLIVCIWVPSVVSAAQDSTTVTTFNSAPRQYKATIDQWSSSCYFNTTTEVLIEAQDGVGSYDQAYTGRCSDGYIAMEGYTFLKVRERHCANPGCYNVLRAVSTKDAVLCCPIYHTWGN